jgi:hypothetical protein
LDMETLLKVKKPGGSMRQLETCSSVVGPAPGKGLKITGPPPDNGAGPSPPL